MPGAPLSLPERKEISHALMLNPAVSWAEVARRLGRHSTTIAREVAGHGGRARYRPGSRSVMPTPPGRGPARRAWRCPDRCGTG